jgi:hypothetical protein
MVRLAVFSRASLVDLVDLLRPQMAGPCLRLPRCAFPSAVCDITGMRQGNQYRVQWGWVPI